MKTIDTQPRIYVGTYEKYNCGSIKGKWLDLHDYSDKEDFLEACKKLHSDEADPELMFQDCEGFPECFYSESSVPDELFDWLALNEGERELLAHYCEATGQDYCEGTIEKAQEAFEGTAESEADFAENHAQMARMIPESLPSWIVIDWERSWKCGLQYDYHTNRAKDGIIWFFLKC